MKNLGRTLGGSAMGWIHRNDNAGERYHRHGGVAGGVMGKLSINDLARVVPSHLTDLGISERKHIRTLGGRIRLVRKTN